MATGTKHSKQRDAIINMLCNRYDHPTAEQLYTDLKLKYPKISLGTVYRNLTLLQSMGKVIKISTNAESDRFDGRTDNHYHFCCQNCNSVTDVKIAVDPDMNSKAQCAINGEITSHSLIFYGICQNCKKMLDK